jgi:hypothetical protein
VHGAPAWAAESLAAELWTATSIVKPVKPAKRAKPAKK